MALLALGDGGPGHLTQVQQFGAVRHGAGRRRHRGHDETETEDPIRLHKGGNEDAGQGEEHEGEDDVVQVGLPAGAGQRAGAGGEEVGGQGGGQGVFDVALAGEGAERGAEGEGAGDAGQGEVWREGDVDLFGVVGRQQERLTVQNLKENNNNIDGGTYGIGR